MSVPPVFWRRSRGARRQGPVDIVEPDEPNRIFDRVPGKCVIHIGGGRVVP